MERHKYVDYSVVIDERICDGFYFSDVLRMFDWYFKNPKELSAPPERVIRGYRLTGARHCALFLALNTGKAERKRNLVYREFGNTGIKMSALGFGCMRLPMRDEGARQVIDDDLAVPMLQRAYEGGVNYYDSAWIVL